jgi:predicted nucleotide-binding protein (sugar kinase/HSP70/actin superfamily)
LKNSYSNIANSGYPNTTKTQENYLKSNFITVIEAFKEEMNKSLKQIEENKIKQVKEINKTVQM